MANSKINGPRCTCYLVKMHAGDSPRAQKGSTWRCVLGINHDGLHRAAASAHQRKWTSEEGVWK